MKKLLLLIIILLPLNILGSLWDCENCYDYGLKLGVNLSKYNYDYSDDGNHKSFDGNYIAGFIGGGVSVLHPSPKVKFQFEYLIDFRAVDYHYNPEINDEKLQKGGVNYVFATFPIEILFKISRYFNFYAGFQFSIPIFLFNKDYEDYEDYNSDSESYSYKKNSSIIEGVEFGFLGGILITVNRYFIDFRAIKTVNNSSAKRDLKVSNISFVTMFGYKF